MCLANIYQRGTGGRLLMKDIAYLKVDGSQIEMENLAGVNRSLRAKINEIDFMSSDVFVDELAPEGNKDEIKERK